MLEIWYVALPSGLYQVSLNQSPRVEDGHGQGSQLETIEIHKIYFKKSSSSEPLDWMLEIQNVALPSGPILSLIR